MKQVFRTLVCKAESATDGTITAIASTPDVDRYGDVVAPSWDLKAFKANPVIMHGHDYEGPVVGKATEIELVGEQLMMSVKFDESETNPVGRRLANQYREGFMQAFSVGFAPGKSTERSKLPNDHAAYQAKGGGFYFEENSLLEVSAVAIPANPHALAVRAKRWALPTEEATAAPDIEGKHVLEVVEDADAGTVTITYQMEAPEAPAEEEPTEAPAEEEAAAEDEDQLMALRSMVRDELLVLLGSHDDEDVQTGLDLFTDSTTAEEPDSFEALFNLGA
jgi:hypothetical protein